jgi:HEAT repeat protein
MTSDDGSADNRTSLSPAQLSAEFFAGPPAVRRREVSRLANRRVDDAHGLDAVRDMLDGGDPGVIAALVWVVGHDDDAGVVRSALFGLSRMSDYAAVPGLLLGLDSTDRASRMHAVKGLGKLRARAAVPDLIPLLDDSYLRMNVAEALVAIRDDRAVEPLRLAAASGPPWRRRRLRQCADLLELAPNRSPT